MHFHMKQAFVGVHYLFHRYRSFGMEYKRRGFIVSVEKLPVCVLAVSFCGSGIYTCENTSGEISSHRHEVHRRTACMGASGFLSVTGRHYVSYILPDFGQMLVGEQFVDGYVVGAVTEMRCLRQLFPGSGRTGYRSHMYFVREQAC